MSAWGRVSEAAPSFSGDDLLSGVPAELTAPSAWSPHHIRLRGKVLHKQLTWLDLEEVKVLRSLGGSGLWAPGGEREGWGVWREGLEGLVGT